METQTPAPVFLQDFYPLITTDNLEATRDFYTRWFGFSVGFESDWFVWLTSAGERPYSLAFMKSDHPSSPPGPEVFGGKGDENPQFLNLITVQFSLAHQAPQWEDHDQ